MYPRIFAGRNVRPFGLRAVPFRGVNRVRACPMLREHVPAHGAHELRIRHYSTPFSSLPDGTRVRTPSGWYSPPTPTTFLPSFVRNVYRFVMDVHTERVRIVRNAKAPGSFEGYRAGLLPARRRWSQISAFSLAAAASRSPRSAQGAPRRVWSSSTRVTQPGNSRRNRGTNNTGYKEEPGWTFVGGDNRCQPGLTV